MKLLEMIRSAFWSLRTNKLRSFLSMLGIIIGVGAVVAVVSIGMGARSQVLRSVSALGSNLMIINPTSVTAQAGTLSMDPADLFTLELAEQLEERSPAIMQVAPQVQNTLLLIHGSTNLRVRTQAVTSAYQSVANYPVRYGRFIHDLDVEHGAQVVALGSRVAEVLFPAENPVGRDIQVAVGERRYDFRVIGVMEPKGQLMVGNYDTQVYVPISTGMNRLFRVERVTSLLAQAVSADLAPIAVQQAEFFLYSRLGSTEGFRITSQDEMLATIGQVAQTLQLMLAAIAGISLMVGGIGVMNIMLVSVTERTQEIGTRKALGAKQRDVLTQFLAESIFLSLAGGSIGLLAGAGLARAASTLGGWPVEVSTASLVVAFTFSAAVGLTAGVYPAVKAARMDPVAALSVE